MPGDEEFLQSCVTFGYTEMEPGITLYHQPSPPIYIWPPAQMSGMLCDHNDIHFTRPCHRELPHLQRGNYLTVVTVKLFMQIQYVKGKSPKVRKTNMLLCSGRTP